MCVLWLMMPDLLSALLVLPITAESAGHWMTLRRLTGTLLGNRPTLETLVLPLLAGERRDVPLLTGKGSSPCEVTSIRGETASRRRFVGDAGGDEVIDDADDSEA